MKSHCPSFPLTLFLRLREQSTPSHPEIQTFPYYQKSSSWLTCKKTCCSSESNIVQLLSVNLEGRLTFQNSYVFVIVLETQREISQVWKFSSLATKKKDSCRRNLFPFGTKSFWVLKKSSEQKACTFGFQLNSFYFPLPFGSYEIIILSDG